jgi:signal peptidase I
MRPRALILILLAAAVPIVSRRLDAVQVRGRSMSPTLLPGERLLVVRARPRVGDIVLAPDPRHPKREVIKRVASVEDGVVALRGDNASASTNARVAPDAVEWRALVRYWPPSRVGVLSRVAPAKAQS